MSNLESVKAHVQKHKRAYIVTGTVVGVGAVAAGAYILGTKTVPKDAFTNVAPKQTLNYKPVMELNVHIEALGDPGNIIQDVTTGTIYASQNQAARALGVSASTVAHHLKGNRGLIDGHQLVKLGKAMVTDEVA